MSRRRSPAAFVAAAVLVAATAIVPTAIGRAAAPARRAGARSVAVRSAAAQTPVRIAFSTWTGYAGFWVGVQKGFFRAHGLDVSIKMVEDPTYRLASLRSGALDGMASTVDTFERAAATGTPLIEVFGIDHSVGGDGIVAKKSITTVKGLKGKTIAVNVGSVSEWFLDYVLTQNGLSIKDVKVQDMPDSGAAGAAFKAGKVDVAVTWEPWLSRAEKTPFGHVLVSSARYPNIIVDDFAFRPDFARAHPAVVTNFVRAYYQAVAYILSHPAQAYPIIARQVGEPATGVAADLSTVKLMSLPESKAYFGTAARHGPIYAISAQAGAFWLRIKRIPRLPDVTSIVDARYLQKL